jgi:hypothetical protein
VLCNGTVRLLACWQPCRYAVRNAAIALRMNARIGASTRGTHRHIGAGKRSFFLDGMQIFTISKCNARPLASST